MHKLVKNTWTLGAMVALALASCKNEALDQKDRSSDDASRVVASIPAPTNVRFNPTTCSIVGQGQPGLFYAVVDDVNLYTELVPSGAYYSVGTNVILKPDGSFQFKFIPRGTRYIVAFRSAEDRDRRIGADGDYRISHSRLVPVDVTCQSNSVPVARFDGVIVNRLVPVAGKYVGTVDVVKNDIDIDGDRLTVTGVNSTEAFVDKIEVVNNKVVFTIDQAKFQRVLRGTASYLVVDGKGATTKGKIVFDVNTCIGCPARTATETGQ